MRTIDRILAQGIHYPDPASLTEAHQRKLDESQAKFEVEMQVAMYGKKGALRRLERQRRDADRRMREVEEDYSKSILGLLKVELFQPYLVIDNIANYVYRQVHNVCIEDFPCVVPPRSGMWMEWPNSTGRERRAVLINSNVEHEDAEACIADARKNFPDAEIGWIVAMKLFLEAEGKVFGPIAEWQFVLNERGRIMGNHYQAYNRRLDPDERLLPMIIPPLQALAFMHCRNVKLEMVDPPEKLSKRHRMKHGQGLVRYQTVRLDVPRKAGGGGTRGVGESPLHIVDGHFAYYGDNHHDGCPPGHPPHGLLFGKFDGIYWMPSHVRGNRQVGEVVTTERTLQIKR